MQIKDLSDLSDLLVRRVNGVRMLRKNMCLGYIYSQFSEVPKLWSAVAYIYDAATHTWFFC